VVKGACLFEITRREPASAPPPALQVLPTGSFFRTRPTACDFCALRDCTVAKDYVESGRTTTVVPNSIRRLSTRTPA
jgi:hypothetical protein